MLGLTMRPVHCGR